MTEHHGGALPTTPEICDRCCAVASCLVDLPGGGELAFCGHHHRAHRERLLSGGARVRSLGR